jgi:acyl-CoA hydrolase
MRRCTAVEAAALVRAVDTLAIPLGPGQPKTFLHELGKREDFTGLRVFGALLSDFFSLFTQPGVHLISGFYGPVERALRDAGHRISFLPADFRRFGKFARQLAPRVMATAAALPDGDGVSLSLHAGASVDELRRCGRDPDRLLVVEASPRLPRTLGLPPHHTHRIELEEIDLLVESGMEPLVLEEKAPNEVELAIADHVGRCIPEGATLQTGIGAVPNQVVHALAQGPGGDYGIHSEMFTSGLMELHEAGKVSNRKGLFDGFSVATFALGSRRLYDWLDGAEDVRFLPVDVVNDPSLISRNRRMISINGALSIDLAGQVVADHLGGAQFSGIGGHEDFVSGAGLAVGDRSIICLPSTVRVNGELRSRIVDAFEAGAVITTPRHQVDVIVTEYGAAEVGGITADERVRALAAIAHPDFRAGLLERR